jgi:L-galactonate 5-dehydrogenase
MKQVKIKSPGNLETCEAPMPVAGKGEILIRLKFVGFCGSDLGTYLGKNPMTSYPRVPGHEISAIIETVGSDVPKGFKKGEAVTVVPYTSCGQCPSCRRGREYACQYNETLGVQRDGAMQEYLSVPWQKVLKAPGLDALELALVEPLTVGFHAISRARVTDADTVAVMGCGMIGAGAIVRAGIRGAKVIAIDIDDHKLELAKALGAHHTINSASQELHDALRGFTAGDGPDVIVEAAGNPVTYKAAVEEAAFTGRVVCIGYAAQEVSFATKLFVQKELDIMGSRNASAGDFRAVISYIGKGDFPLEKMITMQVKPENTAEALQKWADAPGKVMKILLDLR